MIIEPKEYQNHSGNVNPSGCQTCMNLINITIGGVNKLEERVYTLALAVEALKTKGRTESTIIAAIVSTGIVVLSYLINKGLIDKIVTGG